MLMAADVRQVTLLGMLDLSAAFDCVDYMILLQRLRIGFGLTDVALSGSFRFWRNGHSKSPTTVNYPAFSM